VFADNRISAWCYIATAYCLPALLYSCESWSLWYELKPMTVTWNNTFCKIFHCCWRENHRLLLYYCNSLPFAYLIDQCILLFWKHLYYSRNSLLNSLSAICYGNMASLAAKYDIYSPLPSTPDFEIKLHIWKLFEKTVVNWCMYCGFICCVICFIVSNFCVF